jgi:hypothetical protein
MDAELQKERDKVTAAHAALSDLCNRPGPKVLAEFLAVRATARDLYAVALLMMVMEVRKNASDDERGAKRTRTLVSPHREHAHNCHILAHLAADYLVEILDREHGPKLGDESVFDRDFFQ